MKILVLNGSPRQEGKGAILVPACTTPPPLNLILAQSRGTRFALKQV